MTRETVQVVKKEEQAICACSSFGITGLRNSPDSAIPWLNLTFDAFHQQPESVLQAIQHRLHLGNLLLLSLDDIVSEFPDFGILDPGLLAR